MSKKILVTGATGNIGKYIVPQLVKSGASVRALVRDRSKALELNELEVELFEGEFSSQEVLEQAVNGVDAVMAITPAGPDAVIHGDALLQAAVKAGSPHYVRLSAIGAAEDAPTDNGKLHFKSDKALMDSGLPYSILRPHFFMQNLFASVGTIQSEGNMYWGMGDGKLGMIDVRDIADSCVQVLLSKSHVGEILTPTGPDTITFGEIAEIISKGIGKPVNYVQISIDDVGNAIRQAGWGEWGAQVMMDYSKAYAENWGNFINDHVERLSGNKSRSFQQFFDEVLVHAF